MFSSSGRVSLPVPSPFPVGLASLFEFAWMELLEKDKSFTTEELAEIVYGSVEPLESYCAHILLSKDEIYFSVAGSKEFCTVYKPRSTAEVEQLLERKRAKEASENELEEFVQLLKSAKSMPPHSKPSKCSWASEERVKDRIEALEAFTIDECKNDGQKRTAGLILKAMGLPRTSSTAINLLMGIGYFSRHVNLDLLKFNVRTNYSNEVLLAAEDLLFRSPDM